MTPFFLAAFGLVAAVNLGLSLAILLAGARRAASPPRVTLRRVLAAALAVTLATFLAIVVLLFCGLKFFGMVHLAWLDLSVVLPASALVLLVAGRRTVRLSGGVRACAVVALLMIPVALYAQLHETSNLQVEQTAVPIDAARSGDEPLLIGVLADLQTDVIGPHEHAAVDALLAAGPDLILLPGDLFQGTVTAFEEQLGAFQELLGRLHAEGGVWFVMGNVDWPPHVERLLQGTNVQWLENEVVTRRIRGRDVSILGVNSETDVRATLAEFEALPATSDVRLVLSHRPRVVEDLLPDSRVDLVVAGHTHGGQIVLPLFGPPLVLSPLPRHIAAGGLHTLDGRRLYISRGVGHERGQSPRLRFLCPPEISLITLRNAAPGPE